MSQFDTREAWLVAAIDELRPIFAEVGSPLVVPLRVAMGFPSRRALAAKNRVLGECWSAAASADGTTELMVSPTLVEPLAVLATLAHEVTHAVVGVEHKHKKPFVKVIRAIGLDGKPTATFAGDLFKQHVDPIIVRLGPLPHAAITGRLSLRQPRKQSMLKCTCEECGYVARVARQYLNERGAPLCPCNSRPFGYDADGNDENDGGDED